LAHRHHLLTSYVVNSQYVEISEPVIEQMLAALGVDWERELVGAANSRRVAEMGPIAKLKYLLGDFEAQSSEAIRSTKGQSLLSQKPRWGVMVQLYATRSRDSWGIGDFADLKKLIESVAGLGADFVLTNPLFLLYQDPDSADAGAANSGRIEPSPYLPSSRVLLNPLYLRPSGPRPKRPMNNAQIDYDDAWRWKRQALLKQFRSQSGVSNPQADDFDAWLQAECRRQLEECHLAAQAAGMEIGLIDDLPVGVHPAGIDAIQFNDFYLKTLNVGAPPDTFNQLGQNWGQHPWDRRRLEATDYQLWRNLVREVFQYCSALRIDHVLGLFRHWCIPVQNSPSAGAYLEEDRERFFDILVEEANSANALIIGEDLGVVPSPVRPYLQRRAIFGTDLILHNIQPKGLKSPRSYRPNSFASLLSHDYPPVQGYLQGAHLEIQQNLGLLKSPERDWARLRKLVTQLKNEFDTDNIDDVVEGLHRHLATVNSALRCVNLFDLVGQTQPVNQPGTNREYPNWKIPLQDSQGELVFLEDVFDSSRAQRLLSPFALK
jgi:4-alpha-glucanotransferase